MTNTNPKETPETEIDVNAQAADAPETQAAGDTEPEIISASEIFDAEAQAEADAASESHDPVSIDNEDDDDNQENQTQKHIETLEAQVLDLTDKYIRTVAEMENVRRRAQREKEDASKFAIAKFAREILSVSDNITRAFASIEGEGKGVNAAPEDISGQFQSFIEGVKMTEADLMKTLESLGLQKIEPAGKPFDANLHEALFEFEDKTQPAGTVAQVLEQGFTLNGRLLRPAKVGITKGGPKLSAKPASDPAASNTDEAVAKEGQTAYEAKTSGPGSQLNEEL